MRVFLVTLTVAAAAGVLITRLSAEPGRPQRGSGAVRVEPTAFQGQIPPLSFEGATDWINSAPLSAQDLKGKLVLLDFWTYCCINCHHVLPDLARLEQKYKNELVVIGVHTPKFFAERDTENIREKVHEYQIKHPVINDANQALWNKYGVSSWPTLLLFETDGSCVGGVSGEGNYAILDREIGRRIERHKARGDLNTEPVQFYAESDKPDNSPLAYPGKVFADEKGKRLFIADTAHNRLVQVGLDGGKPVVIGSGAAGLANGDYARAQFNRPQGMCLVGDILYVADTENHALRAVDLKARQVSTVAGTGEQSHRRTGSGLGEKTGLNSPWDVIPIPGTNALAIAMSGIHEIWKYDLETTLVSVWAGTGVENIQDGPADVALFSQPSGLASDGKSIFVADSEVSAIREIFTDKRRTFVRTIVGSGLFVFDDVDGQGPEVRLQHCLGVAYGGGKLYIADTYNNKIKVCDPKTARVETFVGRKQPGATDNPPHFYQPGGLSVAGSRLYVADTNNHKIRVVDLKEKTVKTLELEGLKPPAPPRRNPVFPRAKVATLETAKVAPGESLTLEVTVPLEEGFKLSPDVPMPYLVETPEKSGLLADAAIGGQKLDPPATRFSVKVPLAKPLQPGETFALRLSVGSFVCSKTSSLCTVKNFVWNIPVAVTSDGASKIEVASQSE
jgi:thiol-disulfide isomerase/thioredoxin/DNA-binding beta-propeller fold protein YncE